MILSLVFDCVSDKYSSPKELKQAITLILGAIMATDTELVVPFVLHFNLRNSAWFSHLVE